MKLTDTEQNTEFLYFFIKKFKWTDPIENERFGGHPKSGRIYRGWRNIETNNYRIAPGTSNPFFIESLNQLVGDTGYISEIVIIDKFNILDLPIIEEDLDNIIKWIESDNKDLKQQIFKTTEQAIIAVIQNAMKPVNNSFQGFIESAEELQGLDPAGFDVVWGFIDFLLLQMHNPEESIDADWLSKGPNGAHINMANALKCINRYAGTDRRTNLDPDDLLEAMSHITNELIRSELHEKD